MVNRILSVSLTLLLVGACEQERNFSDDLDQLQALQHQQELAHMEKRAHFLTEMFAEDFINIDSGNISRPTKEQAHERFQSYFDSVEFIVWENINEPVIRISKDGSMAYIIVQKFVHLEIPQANGPAIENKTTFAWMEVWEKTDGNWKLKVIASTDDTGG